MNIARAFGSLAFLTFLSRVSGFVRVALFATFYGGGADADLFLAVMIIPELMYRFMSDGLVAGAAIPLFAVCRDDPSRSGRSFWQVFWGLFGVGFLLSSLLMLFAGRLSSMMVPGFHPGAHLKMVVLWRIVSPLVLFSLLSGLMTAFLNARGIFARPAFSNLFSNGSIIAGILVLRGSDVQSLGAFILAGSLLQLIVLWLVAVRNGLGADPLNVFREGDFTILREFLENSAPIGAWIFLTPVVPVFERYLLSSLPEGSVAVLHYSDKLVNLPLGIVSISLATVIFPILSREGGESRREVLLGTGWWLMVFLLPVMVIIQAASEPIVAVTYFRGKFSMGNVGTTAAVFKAYSWILLPLSVSMLLNRALFAAGRFRLPFLFGALSVVLQVGADVWFVGRTGCVGVGWGAAAGAFFQNLLLLGWLFFDSPCRKRVLAFFLGEVGILVATLLTAPLVRRAYEMLVGAVPTGGSMGMVLALGLVWAFMQVVTGLGGIRFLDRKFGKTPDKGGGPSQG